MKTSRGSVCRRCVLIAQGEEGGYLLELGEYNAFGTVLDTHKLIFPTWAAAGMALVDFFEPLVKPEAETGEGGN